MTYYRKRVAIAFTATATGVSIIGVFYGGQDYQASLGQYLES